nr:MAG TPA: Glycine rich protein family [Crassvirales sp.]
MNKNIIIVLLSTLCCVLLVVTYVSAKENYQYKLYYEKAEKLFDEVEEDNEAYFDTDKGADYLYQRNKIKLMNR